jgi:geranyl-CoA carboxylase alpha subunit
MSFDRVLIANRGEIAIRIADSARRLGLTTVAIYSDADRAAPHVAACDLALPIGGTAPAESYLAVDKILEAARRSGAQAIHPGYGFLSENARFAQAVLDAGLTFIGPPPAAIAAMGDKALARQRMAAVGVAVLPGYDGDDQSDETFEREAQRIGYPVMIKAAGGGGGRGMRLVLSATQLRAALSSARSETASAFGNPRLILERALLEARHVEVQVLADFTGHTVHLGERDCSIQRRHQKIVEEAPAPGIDAQLRARIGAAAVQAACTVGYVGAGTVEFLYDGREFFFMEMNTRLQVEHPVTEGVTGIDLVEWQFRVARGEPLPWKQHDIALAGHAIEVRLCAEDPVLDFLPQAGRIEHWRAPAGVRVDHAVASGLELSPYYDSMLGKIIAHGSTREEARRRLRNALEDTVLFGVATNRAFLARVLDHPAFAAGELSTAFITRHFADPAARAVAPSDLTWALAAWLTVQPPQELADAWRGFTSAGTARLPVRLGYREAERSGYVTHSRDGPTEVVMEGKTMTLGPHAGYVSRQVAGRLYLQTVDGEWTFDDRRLAARAAGEEGGRDGRLLSPINGRVAQVAAVAGARVARGDRLVTLEAMKMEHALTARVAGTVAAVHVAVNDQVSPGRVLVEVTPDEGPRSR